MIDLEMGPREFLSPLDLFKTWAFDIFEPSKFVIVGK